MLLTNNRGVPSRPAEGGDHFVLPRFGMSKEPQQPSVKACPIFGPTDRRDDRCDSDKNGCDQVMQQLSAT